MIANLVNQQVTNSGALPDLELGIALPSFIEAGSVFNNGDQVFYSLVEGNNRELGIGTYVTGTPNKITRTKVFEVLEDGTYNAAVPPATYLEINGNAEVSVSPSIQSLTTHRPSWKRIYGQYTLASDAYMAAPDTDDFLGTIKIPYFDKTTSESIGVSLTVGHDIAANTDLYIGVHWVPRDAQIGTVRWGLEIAAINPGSAFVAEGTQYIEQSTDGTANKHYLAEFPVSLSIPTPNTIIVARLFRDAGNGNDDYDADAGLIQVSGAYLATYVGTPAKDADFFDWG